MVVYVTINFCHLDNLKDEDIKVVAPIGEEKIKESEVKVMIKECAKDVYFLKNCLERLRKYVKTKILI